MNSKQKNGLIGTIAAILILIGLHNPFSGYITTYDAPPNPSASTFLERMGLPTPLNFFDWRSIGAPLKWIDTTGELLGFISMIIIFGAAIFFINKSKDTSK